MTSNTYPEKALGPRWTTGRLLDSCTHIDLLVRQLRREVERAGEDGFAPHCTRFLDAMKAWQEGLR